MFFEKVKVRVNSFICISSSVSPILIFDILSSTSSSASRSNGLPTILNGSADADDPDLGATGVPGDDVEMPFSLPVCPSLFSFSLAFNALPFFSNHSLSSRTIFRLRYVPSK